MGTQGCGEPLCGHRDGGEIVAARQSGLAYLLDLGLDHGQGGRPRHHWLVRLAVVGEQPVDMVRDRRAPRAELA